MATDSRSDPSLIARSGDVLVSMFLYIPHQSNYMHTSFHQLRCVHQTCASCKFYNFYPGDKSCQVELDQEPTEDIKVAEAEWDSYLPKSDPSQNYFTEEMKFKGRNNCRKHNEAGPALVRHCFPLGRQHCSATTTTTTATTTTSTTTSGNKLIVLLKAKNH